jgi:DNA-binding NarL/FixJ family response regulator
VRVVIGEDEALMRGGLTLVLEQAGFEIVGVAEGGEDVVRKARAHRPDLLVTDIRMPPDHTDEGLRAALTLRAERPQLAVLVLSQHVQRRYASELLEQDAGGVGYLLKQRIANVDVFIGDVRRICSGGTVLDPEVVATLLGRARHEDDPIHQLTERQREVLALMAEGRSNAAIAHQLVITEKAVVRHVSHVYEMLGLPNSNDDHRRVLAVVRYLTL